ncbi:MAG: type II secretion system F family protein, partial [Stellaceae bacterium]
MPSFRWSAVNPGGDVARGVMEAPDRAAVVERLQRQGQIVLRADLTSGRGGWADFLQVELGRGRGLDKAALGEVTRELSIMLGAGQDLDRALRFVVENTRNARA